jgi:hypothetical protein
MDGFVQIKMLKRMAPMFPFLALMQDIGKDEEKAKVDSSQADVAVPEGISMSAEKFRAIAPQLTKALSTLSDNDVDFIIQSCLTVTRVLEANLWCDVWNKRAGVVQYAWLDGMSMLTIAVYVILDNVGSFSNALDVPGLPSGATAQTTAR